METWLEDAISDIFANTTVVRVPSAGRHVRFYTEALETQQWDHTHHLIDLEYHESVASRLTITQLSTEGASQVTLADNEVDDLLTVLLERRLEEARLGRLSALEAEPPQTESDKPSF